MTTPKTDALMALADRYAFHIPGSQHSDEARAVLLAALQEQAREGEVVAIKDAVGCVLEGWTLPEPVRKILETAYYAAPQPAQPDHIADTNKMVPADHVEQHLDMVEQPEQVDWKDQYEKQKRRAEMWIAKYEKDIGPLEKVYPAAQPEQGEGEAVAPSAILARGRFHTFKGEDGEPDDWEWFEEGTNCEHGCIDAVIVRADAM